MVTGDNQGHPAESGSGDRQPDDEPPSSHLADDFFEDSAEQPLLLRGEGGGNLLGEVQMILVVFAKKPLSLFR